MNKIQSLIGFALKSRQAVLGFDAICQKKQAPELIIACKSLAKNTQKRLYAYAEDRQVEVIVPQRSSVEELTARCGCKVVAIYNKHMAKGITDSKADLC